MYCMGREVRYVSQFEVKYCVLKLKEKFIYFLSGRSPIGNMWMTVKCQPFLILKVQI